MKWKKETAADIVMGTAAKVAEDMVHGTASAVKDISEYHSMYRNMEGALNQAAGNLSKHMLRKKWMSKDDRKKLRAQISQIKAMAKICRRMMLWCSGFAGGTIMELKKFEGNRKLSEIVDSIESEDAE
jgi:hypothetical protein